MNLFPGPVCPPFPIPIGSSCHKAFTGVPGTPRKNKLPFLSTARFSHGAAGEVAVGCWHLLPL